MSVQWSPGDVIALRFLPMGKLRWAKPVRVVEDSDDVTALFLEAGTPMKVPAHPATGATISRSLSYEDRFRTDWKLGDGIWRDNSVLMLSRPGAAHSFWAFWRASDWEFLAWYVNLQAPLARTSVGFDTEDHVLDVVVEPDLMSWEWKDEDELADAVRLGRFTSNEAAQIRAEGEAALNTILERQWPVNDGWADWRPPGHWTLPSLPTGWDLDQ